MLTAEEKKELERCWLEQAAFLGNVPHKPYPPKMGCVYAFEMQDGTVKIGVTQNHDERIISVQQARCLDVLRVHHTGYAPYSFMTKLEIICHKAFAERRVRGEYFDISFEEAVAELDSHAEEIAAALHEADRIFMGKVDYYFNEFLPEYNKMVTTVDGAVANLSVVYVLNLLNDSVAIGTTKNLDAKIKFLAECKGMTVTHFHTTPFMYHEVAGEIESTLHRKYARLKVNGEFFNANYDDVCTELDKLAEYELCEETITVPAEITDFERGKELVKLIAVMEPSPDKNFLVRETANLLLGRKIF